MFSKIFNPSFLELKEGNTPSQATQVDPVPSTSAEQPPRKKIRANKLIRKKTISKTFRSFDEAKAFDVAIKV